MSTVSAAQAVGEYLQSPDDLLKVSAFRKKLAKEKASIDAKLKSGVKDQLEATREGLRRLVGTRNNVQTIKDELLGVEIMFKDPQNEIKTFDQISRVSMVHRNFAMTEEMVNNLTEMYSRLDMLEAQLGACREDVFGPATYLLTIHYQLNQLESFRNETLHQAKRAKADVRNTLKRHFERLDRVIDSFEEHIHDMAANLLEIVRSGNPSAVVKLIKIAEMEGKEDEKAIGIKLVKKAARMDAAAKFKSMVADARRIKHYRSTILSKITESISAKFTAAYERSARDPFDFLDNLSWMYQDLLRVESDLAPCFPEDWDIYAQYVRKYHKALDQAIRRIVDLAPEASVILRLHAHLKQYKKDMKELEVNPEWITPALMDGKEQVLIDDYVSLIIKKLDEWTANIMKDEVKEFTTREQAPEANADGLYGMERTVILFQMVNQQVDLALESGQGAVLAKVVSEASRVLRGTQEGWLTVIDAELKKQLDKPEEVPGGLVEYIVAVANDQIKSADYCEAISARLEDLVSDKYRTVIRERLNDVIDGYIDVINKCTQAFIDLIFNDLKPATKLLFSPGWYGGIMPSIIETMRDYMTDYQTYLNPSILDLLIENLLDNFLITYLTALHKSSKLRMPAAGDRVKNDIAEAFDFFTTLKPAEELEASFEILDMAHALLTASKNLVFLSFWNFGKIHGPNLIFVEGLMKARDDLDRSAVNEVMDSVKRKAKEENITDPPEPTIMKKIAIQSGFAAFLSRRD